MIRDDLLSQLAPLPAPSAPSAGRTTVAAAPSSSTTTTRHDASLFGTDGFTFADFLDIINPLQHIPIVASIYRHLSGDTIDPGSRVAGGALYGGVIGAAIGGANAILQEATGKDAGELVISMLTGDSTAPDAAPTAVADAASKSPASDAQPPPVPDLAMLGALPPESPAGTPDAAQIAAKPATPAAPIAASTLIDLAQLAPLPAEVPTVVAQARPGAAPAVPDGDRDEHAATRTAATPEAIPDGAVASDGGWFTQVMLEALDKYKAAAQLAADTRAPDAATQRN